MSLTSEMIQTCDNRNGNCKKCIFYGKSCAAFRRQHGGLSPADYITEKENLRFAERENNYGTKKCKSSRKHGEEKF